MIHRRLHEILMGFQLITTAESERRRLFLDSPLTQPSIRDPWVNHTMHIFKSLLLVHHRLKESTFEFHDVPRSVGIDIIRKDSGDNGTPHFKVNSRLLDFEYIHDSDTQCSLKRGYKAGTTAPGTVCDCGAEELLDVVLNEVGFTGKNMKKIQRRCRWLIQAMPRHLNVKSEEIGGQLKVELTWETLLSKRFGNGYKFLVFKRHYGDVVHNSHRYLPPDPPVPEPSSILSEPGPLDLNPPARSGSQSIAETSENHQGADKASETAPSPENPTDLPIWMGTAPREATSLQIPLQQSRIYAGGEYIVLGLYESNDGALYSEPFHFTIPFPTPRILSVIRRIQQLTVSWEMPDVDAKLLLTCHAGAERIYSQDNLSHPPYAQVQIIPVAERYSKVDLIVTICATVLGDTPITKEASVRSDALPPPITEPRYPQHPPNPSRAASRPTVPSTRGMPPGFQERESNIRVDTAIGSDLYSSSGSSTSGDTFYDFADNYDEDKDPSEDGEDEEDEDEEDEDEEEDVGYGVSDCGSAGLMEADGIEPRLEETGTQKAGNELDSSTQVMV